MRKYDWKRNGCEHLERGGCIINIYENLQDSTGTDLTRIDILADDGTSRSIRITDEGKILR